MPQIVPVVLMAWVAASLALFWRRPGRDAALLALVGGWALLPVASYPVGVFGWPVGTVSKMHALAVPTPILVNKATTIGLGCLLGAIAFDWPALRRVRPSRLDLPMIAWCLLPTILAPLNGIALAAGLAQTRYQALAWGVPYLMGRAYLVDNESLRRFGLALAAAGLAYAPLCLAEFVAGPFLYDLAYGPHPYQFDGAERYVLYRPLVWLEHGNQLGTWSAVAAVTAFWLWRSGRLPRFWGVSPGVATGVLAAVCVLGQSLGAVVLMASVMAAALLAGRVATLPRRTVAAGALAIVVLLAVAASGWLSRDRVKGLFAGIGKSSFTWRLARYEQHFGPILERPLTGWSTPDWSATDGGTFVCPAALGLWFLTLGQFGAVGLAVLACVVWFPASEVVRWLPPRSWLNPGCSGATLAAVLLLLGAADALFNSVVILPLLAGAGGLISWSLRRFAGA